MTTQKSPSRGILLIILVLAAVVLGGGWYVQQEVEKQVRAQITEQIKKIGTVNSVGNVSYSLLSNTLEVTDIKAEQTEPQAVTYSIARITGRNINRSLVLAAIMGKLTEQKGTLSVIDTVEIDNYRSVVKQAVMPEDDTADIDILVPKQVITNITVNMDILGPLLAKKDFSDTELLLGLFQSCAYASRVVPEGTKGVITTKELKGDLTMGAAEERNVGAGGIEYAISRGMNLKFMQKDKEVLNFSMGELTMERVYFSPEVIKQLLAAENDPEKIDEKAMLKAVFLGDRPLVGVFRIKNVKTKIDNEQYDFAEFVYENSSTKPFALTVSLNGLKLPTSVLPEDALMATQLMGISHFTSNYSFSGLFPLEDPAGMTKMTLTSSVDKIGGVSMITEGVLPEKMTVADLESPNLASKSFMASLLKVSYTDAGLVPLGMKLAEKMMGLNATQALAFVENTQKAEVASGKLSQANLDAIMAFLRQPGTISLTVAPKTPVPLTELLDELNLAADGSVLEVTKGEKTLEEQVKAQ